MTIVDVDEATQQFLRRAESEGLIDVAYATVDTPVGPLRALRPPTRLQGIEPAMGAIPTVGQHSDAVLLELGFEHHMIATWRKSGVI